MTVNNSDWEFMRDKKEEIRKFKQFNITMDMIESIILAHAIAGIDIEEPAYLEGIETAIDVFNNIHVS